MVRGLVSAGLLIAALALGPLGPALAEDSILPGYWESTSKVTFPFPDKKTERKCVTSAQISQYLNGPSNNHYTCVYENRRVENGQASMDGQCVDNNGLKSKIRIEGTYSPVSFNLDGHVNLMLAGIPIPIHASIDAHRISETCPIEEKR